MQLNPHFLYNTLSFLYSRAVPLSGELADGIMTLSHILRYSLAEETDSRGRVLLSKEIDHFKNIIKMNQLRYKNQLPIHVTVTGNVANLRIMPFALMAIIENALKHGDIFDVQKPITIKTEISDEWIHFYCHNLKKKWPCGVSTKHGYE
jgi:LytS/YehU family sensor histidine kinase